MPTAAEFIAECYVQTARNHPDKPTVIYVSSALYNDYVANLNLGRLRLHNGRPLFQDAEVYNAILSNRWMVAAFDYPNGRRVYTNFVSLRGENDQDIKVIDVDFSD